MEADPGQARTNLHRLRQLTWWSTAGLAYVAGPIAAATIVPAGGPAPGRAGALVGALATSASAGWLLARPLRRAPGPAAGAPDARSVVVDRVSAWAAAGGCAGAATVALLGPQLGPVSPWSPAAPALMTAALAVSVSRRAWLPVVGGGMALAALLAAAGSWLAAGEADPRLVWTALFMAAGFSFAMLFQYWMWDVARRLDDARQLAGELAVAGERLRFAADLHDIQGHHLQVIAFKSELAARLAGTDAPAAAGHMTAVQRLALTALEDTREVVRGYRRVSLVDELANAARVLAAAGIDCEPPPAERTAARLPEPARHLLGLVVREAATNVLRHSQARRATLRLTVEEAAAVLESRNDGVRSAPDGDGTGLRALAGRLAAAGGSLEWGHDADGWFRVTACVPLVALADA